MQIKVFSEITYPFSFQVWTLECLVKLHIHSVSKSELWPPRVLLLCCSWGGLCASKTPEAMPAGVWLLVGFTMLDRLWGRDQTKCNTDATDDGNISAWTELVYDPVVGCPSQSPDWTSHGPTTRNAWVCVLCHLSCGYPLLSDAESLACHAGG